MNSDTIFYCRCCHYAFVDSEAKYDAKWAENYLCPRCGDGEADSDGEDILHEVFVNDIWPVFADSIEQDGKPDYPARRMAFNDWIDSEEKGGTISSDAAAIIGPPGMCNAE